MRKAILGVLLVMLCYAPFSVAQNTDELDIDRLFQDLRQTLIRRSTPEDLLSPSLTASQRQKEAQKAVRPYVTLQFKYNIADLQRTNTNEAKLPLIMEWETARESGRLTDSAELEKVGDRWYFRDFDFMAFPWVIVLGACSIGVAFAIVVLYLYRRSSKRQRQPVPA
jgi:hypothetical protein